MPARCLRRLRSLHEPGGFLASDYFRVRFVRPTKVTVYQLAGNCCFRRNLRTFPRQSHLCRRVHASCLGLRNSEGQTDKLPRRCDFSDFVFYRVEQCASASIGHNLWKHSRGAQPAADANNPLLSAP